jgi:hypothetical protein
VFKIPLIWNIGGEGNRWWLEKWGVTTGRERGISDVVLLWVFLAMEREKSKRWWEGRGSRRRERYIKEEKIKERGRKGL